MHALVVTPGLPGSARLTEVAEPALEEGPLLLEMVAVGVCGTDVEILRGDYGEAPVGEEFLVLGHESLGRVLEARRRHGLPPGPSSMHQLRRG